MSQNPLRSQFPIFRKKILGQDLVYFDSAATTQKPQIVIDSITSFYQSQNSSNHSVHHLANQLSFAVEDTRQTVARHINAKVDEIVFTSGATESLNLIANGFLIASIQASKSIYKLQKSDKILIGIAEHHANILPWQRLATLIGCQIEYFSVLASGEVDMLDFEQKLKNCKIVCFSHISNVLGVINHVSKMCQLAKDNGVISIVDGTQALAHTRINLSQIQADFYCFSAHKVYGPTGIGALFGRQELLQELPNYQVGGEMVSTVCIEKNTFRDSPYRFEAGTANFAGIIGFKTALQWYAQNQTQILQLETRLEKYLRTKLKKVENLQIYGTAESKIPLYTCNVKSINGLDLATELDFAGIAIRSGQHCTGLLHQYLGVASSWRVSLGCYNTETEIDYFIEKLQILIDKYRLK